MAINSLYSKEKYDIYVTGSNGFLLSADLATLFARRYIEIHVFPFSFQEYCQYYDDVRDQEKFFDDYSVKGGLAGSYVYRTEKDRTNYIREVYETIVTRDLVQKYSLPDSLVLRHLSEFLMDNISSLTSPNKVSRLLNANEMPTNHVTVGKLYQKEIDFVAQRGSERIYIQVSDDISRQQTFEREYSPLLQIRDAYPKMIIARTRHPKYSYEGIEICDIADWLLEE